MCGGRAADLWRWVSTALHSICCLIYEFISCTKFSEGVRWYIFSPIGNSGFTSRSPMSSTSNIRGLTGTINNGKDAGTSLFMKEFLIFSCKGCCRFRLPVLCILGCLYRLASEGRAACKSIISHGFGKQMQLSSTSVQVQVVVMILRRSVQFCQSTLLTMLHS